MKSPTRSEPLSKGTARIWRMGQWTAVGVLGAVIVGLFVQPQVTLRVAWFGIVPILPASFLVNAELWRGVCPIATANVVGSPPDGRMLAHTWLRASALVGVTLLLVLVPARHLILNTNGPALAVTLIVVSAAALVLGRVYRHKAGFCNSICPILPVEKLYGQSPLVYVRNARCVPCSHCTIGGCMDLNQARAATSRSEQSLGRNWIRTPFGLFAAAFPGLIWGYFQTADAGLTSWMAVYGSVFLPAAVSLCVLGGAIALFNLHATLSTPVLGAIGIALYYWYAGPASAAAFQLPDSVGLGIRWGMVALATLWLVRALRADTRWLGITSRPPARRG